MTSATTSDFTMEEAVNATDQASPTQDEPEQLEDIEHYLDLARANALRNSMRRRRTSSGAGPPLSSTTQRQRPSPPQRVTFMEHISGWTIPRRLTIQLKDLDALDQRIYQLHEAGNSFASIAQELHSQDGSNYEESAIQDRYFRFIIPTLCYVQEEDYEILERAYIDVDQDLAGQQQDLEHKRWFMVADKMKEMGASRYPALSVKWACDYLFWTPATPMDS